jgi:hypothetical protein
MSVRKVVFVSRLRTGAEEQLTHDLPIEFPAHALSQIDELKGVTICQGSGLFVAIIEYEGDFEKLLHSYFSSASIHSFHFKIEKFFASPPGTTDPASLPLAGDVFQWDGERLRQTTG